MKPLDFPLLVDENVQHAVVERLRSRGKQVRTVREASLERASDVAVLDAAFRMGEVVLTHDGDFGTLALRTGRPFVGIVYLRPGHIAPEFILEILDALERTAADVQVPFVIVAERRGDTVRIRVRQATLDNPP